MFCFVAKTQTDDFAEHVVLFQSAVSKISINCKKLFVPSKTQSQEICPASIVEIYKEEYRQGSGTKHTDNSFTILTKPIGYCVQRSDTELDKVVAPVSRVPVQIALCQKSCAGQDCMLAQVHKCWYHTCFIADVGVENPKTYLHLQFVNGGPDACWKWYNHCARSFETSRFAQEPVAMKWNIVNTVCLCLLTYDRILCLS